MREKTASRAGRGYKTRLLAILFSGLAVLPNNPFVVAAVAQAVRPESVAGGARLDLPSAVVAAPLSETSLAPVAAVPDQAALGATPLASPAPAAEPDPVPQQAAAPSVSIPIALRGVEPGRLRGGLDLVGAPAAGGADDGGRLFDGEKPAALMREVLGSGTRQKDGKRIQPFSFHVSAFNGPAIYKARGAGLEGFIYSKNEMERAFGKDALLHHLEDFFAYMENLLSPAVSLPAAAKLLEQSRQIRAQAGDASEKNVRLGALLDQTVAEMQRQLTAEQPSSWMRTARVYSFFSRAFNLPGWRAWRGLPAGTPGAKLFSDFSAADFAEIKKNFDTIWPIGVFPIGERNRKGTSGGSPYSIKDHTAINPEFGTKEDFKAFVARAHQAGLKVIMDFVPNHTSTDSRLLEEHPEYFIRREVEGDPQKAPAGFFPYHSDLLGRWIWVSYGAYDYNGERAYWTDTAQLDYSRQDVRDAMAEIAADWVAETGIDGFRVDMAYGLTNAYFSRVWGKVMPAGEFLEQLTGQVRRPIQATGVGGEVYDLRTQIGAMGLDVLYNKNSQDTSLGEYGWYDAWMKGDIDLIRQSIRDVCYLIWQKASSTGWQFIGNHDETGPQGRIRSGNQPSSGLGKNWKVAAVMTLMLPGALLFYGSQEAGFDRPDLKDLPKSISFQSPASVDWNEHPDVSAFFDKLFVQVQAMRRDLGPSPAMEFLELDGGAIGYILKPTAASPDRNHFYVVIGNTDDYSVRIRLVRPDLGVSFDGLQQPGTANVLRFMLPHHEAGHT